MPQGNPDYLDETYYNNTFKNSGASGARIPTYDEILHVTAIIHILSRIAHEYYLKSTTPLKILDVGCNRGWLTYILNMYGDAQGVEAKESVYNIAREIFS